MYMGKQFKNEMKNRGSRQVECGTRQRVKMQDNPENNITKHIIQKKDPTTHHIPINTVLTHGSKNMVFYSNMETRARKNTQLPDGPAWFGNDDFFISILATIRNKKGNFPVYTYQNKSDMTLSKWETWAEALEYLLRKNEAKFSYPLIKSRVKALCKSEPTEKDVEKYLPTSSKNRGDKIIYILLKQHKLHWQTKYAANKLKRFISPLKGYYLDHDPGLESSPQFVLYNITEEDLTQIKREIVYVEKCQNGSDGNIYKITFRGKEFLYDKTKKGELMTKSNVIIDNKNSFNSYLSAI